MSDEQKRLCNKGYHCVNTLFAMGVNEPTSHVSLDNEQAQQLLAYYAILNQTGDRTTALDCAAVQSYNWRDLEGVRLRKWVEYFEEFRELMPKYLSDEVEKEATAAGK
ncbi:hypothetical protein IAT38_004936 [Cryptococcus sp. DSM 104549]